MGGGTWGGRGPDARFPPPLLPAAARGDITCDVGFVEGNASDTNEAGPFKEEMEPPRDSAAGFVAAEVARPRGVGALPA